MATFTSALAQLATECETEGLTVQNSEKIAGELAKIFGVRQEEVGMLRLEKESLVFVHPAKLHNVGRIPLNSPGSVAVRTVHNKRPEIINNFVHTRHATFFEMVDLSNKYGQQPKGKNKDEQIIQKLMSVPVTKENQVVGVIQVCRKGANPGAAGPDFTPADLQHLTAAAAALIKCFG
jgi:GAF domain-containing protein